MLRTLLLVLCLLAAPAWAGHSSQIDVDVAEGGPVAIGGSANGVLSDLQGTLVVPIQVTTGCDTATTDAWVAAQAQVVDQLPTLMLSIRANKEPSYSPCEAQWLAKSAQFLVRVPLVAGQSKITVDQGPMQGFSVTVSSEAGQPAPQ